MITGLFKAVLTKLFPSLSYKGVVDAQIKLYQKLIASGETEQDALNKLLDSRRLISGDFDMGANDYYQDIMMLPNKTLAQAIKAIVEWEYVYNMKSYELRGSHKIPQEYVDQFKKDITTYIEDRIAAVSR